MELKILREINELAEISEAWDTLVRESHDDKIHYTYFWFTNSYDVFNSDDQLYVITVYGEDGSLNCIVPLVIISEKYRFFKLRKICFPRNPQNPSNDFICKKGYEEQCYQVVLAHLGQFLIWDLIDLQMIDGVGITSRLLDKYLKSHTFKFHSYPNRVSPYITVKGTWDDFWSNRSSKFRKGMRNKINRGKKKEYKIDAIRDFKNPETLELMRSISSKSWKRSIGTDLLTKKDNFNFYELISRHFGNLGKATLYLLKLEDQPAAFEFHFEYDNVVYPIRADYDESYKAYSPGSILEYEIIKSLFEKSDIDEYNSCGHTYQYLLNWTETSREYLNFEVFRPSLFPSLAYQIEYIVIPALRKSSVVRFFKK